MKTVTVLLLAILLPICKLHLIVDWMSDIKRKKFWWPQCLRITAEKVSHLTLNFSPPQQCWESIEGASLFLPTHLAHCLCGWVHLPWGGARCADRTPRHGTRLSSLSHPAAQPWCTWESAGTLWGWGNWWGINPETTSPPPISSCMVLYRVCTAFGKQYSFQGLFKVFKEPFFFIKDLMECLKWFWDGWVGEQPTFATTNHCAC